MWHDYFMGKIETRNNLISNYERINCYQFTYMTNTVLSCEKPIEIDIGVINDESKVSMNNGNAANRSTLEF